MNKKKYIAPAIEVAEVEVTISILAGSELNYRPDEEPDEELSNGRRGQWGNLWADR